MWMDQLATDLAGGWWLQDQLKIDKSTAAPLLEEPKDMPIAEGDIHGRYLSVNCLKGAC